MYDVGFGIHGLNGWKGWDDDQGLDVVVTDIQALSVFNAVEVAGGAKVVHEFEEHTSDRWKFSTWQYIPGGFESGSTEPMAGSYFILLNSYEDGAPHPDSDISLQMNFDSNDGMLKVYYGNGLNKINVGYVPDEWVELQATIDLNTDSISVYYDGNFVTEYGWSVGVYGGGGGG